MNNLGIDENSPFHLACWRSDLGDTSLHYAARTERIMIVKALLEAGAIKNLINECNETPLNIADVTKNLNNIHWLHNA